MIAVSAAGRRRAKRDARSGTPRLIVRLGRKRPSVPSSANSLYRIPERDVSRGARLPSCSAQGERAEDAGGEDEQALMPISPQQHDRRDEGEDDRHRSVGGAARQRRDAGPDEPEADRRRGARDPLAPRVSAQPLPAVPDGIDDDGGRDEDRDRRDDG